MGLHEHLAAYGVVIGGVWFAFAKAEELLSPARLRWIYRQIYERAPSRRSRWPLYILLFVDAAFKFRKAGRIFVPSATRVGAYTAALILFVLIVPDSPPGSFMEQLRWLLFFWPLLFVINLPLDIIAVAKTRFLVQTMRHSASILLNLVLLVIEIGIACILVSIATLAFGIIHYYLVENFGSALATVYNPEIHYDRDSPDWDETLYQAGFKGSPYALLAGLASLLSAVVSSIMILLFFMSLVVVKLLKKVGVVQRWVRENAIAEAHPIQVLGLIGLSVMSIVYWFIIFFSEIVH